MRKTITELLDSKILYILLSLVASFVLWLFVVNSVNPSQVITLTFDVVYEGESVMEAYNLRLASDNPDTIRLRIDASVTDINRLQQNQQVIVDVSGIHEAGEHDVGFRFATWSTLTGIVSASTVDSRVSNTDDTIVVRATRVTGHTFDLSSGGVLYRIAESEAEDYFFIRHSLSLEPGSIHIDGPEEVLNRIARIEVEANFVEPLRETATQEGTLRAYDEYGEVISADELQDVTVASDTPFAEARVSVTVIVRTVKNIPLDVQFEYGAGANADNVHYHLDRDSVWLIGEADVLQTVAAMGRLSLGRIYLARVGMIDVVRLQITPPPLTALYGTNEYVDVEIEISGLEERSVTIPSSQIHFTGRAEGMIAEAAIDTLSIIIRGPADMLEDLDESIISILVDLSDYAGRTGNLLVETFTVRVGAWEPEIIGARDLLGEGIIVSLREET